MLYIPPHFRDTDTEKLGSAINAGTGFATLISNGAQGPIVTPLPLMYDPSGSPLGRLVGHIARANPHWKSADLTTPTLALFHGPDAYVSPGWYASKREHGKVVPTWNYTLIHAVGQLIVHEDAEWLRQVVTRLTERHERTRADVWAVTDAPDDFIRAQLKGIVGVELVLTELTGKTKLSQNRPEADQTGVIAGLDQADDPGSAQVSNAMRVRRARDQAAS